MNAKSLFGVQFTQLPVYKNRILGEFEMWKTDKQRFFDRQKQRYLFFFTLMLMKQEELPGATRQEIMVAVRNEMYNPRPVKLPAEAVKSIAERFNYCDIELFEVEELLRDDGCKPYYVTASVIEECSRLKCKEPFDLAWLEPIPDGKRQLNFGSWIFRMDKKGAKIIVLSAHHTDRQEYDYLEYTFFHLDLVEKTQSHMLFHDTIDDLFNENSSKEFDAKSRKLFFRLLTFIILAPVEEVYLPAGRKHGNKNVPGSLVNDSRFPMTIIDAKWNRAIHVGKIPVEPFYRLQPYGEGSKLRRLRYIDHHYRDGYNIYPKNKSTF